MAFGGRIRELWTLFLVDKTALSAFGELYPNNLNGTVDAHSHTDKGIIQLDRLSD